MSFCYEQIYINYAQHYERNLAPVHITNQKPVSEREISQINKYPKSLPREI